MKYGTIAGIEQPVSRLIIGSGKFAHRTRGRAFDILDQYRDAGGNAVDTAAVYGGGEAEEVIGAWLRERGHREDLVIVGKGAAPAEADATGRPAWIRRVDPKSIVHDLTGSLERLQVDTIDLYMLHRDDITIPVEVVVDCMNDQQRLGRIRAYGGSNWSPERIAQANGYATAHGMHQMVASSPQFSLAVAQARPARDAVYLGGDTTSLRWYHDHEVSLIPWSSQSEGWFQLSDVDQSTRRQLAADPPHTYGGRANVERRRRARELSFSLNATPNQVALAWLLHLPMRVFPIIGTLTPSHLADSLGAVSLDMTAEQVAWLNLERAPA